MNQLQERNALLVTENESLKAERDALATENGLAAKAVQTFCEVVGSNTDVIAEEMGMEGAKAILAAMIATGNMPATDAYLNSVRAEGAIAVRDALVLAEDGADIYATSTLVADQLRGVKDGE